MVIELSWSLRASRRLPLRDITWCSPLLSILRSVIVEVFAGGEPTPQPGIDANLNSIVLITLAPSGLRFSNIKFYISASLKLIYVLWNATM